MDSIPAIGLGRIIRHLAGAPFFGRRQHNHMFCTVLLPFKAMKNSCNLNWCACTGAKVQLAQTCKAQCVFATLIDSVLFPACVF